MLRKPWFSRLRSALCIGGLVLGNAAPAGAQAKAPPAERERQELVAALSTTRANGCTGVPGVQTRLRWTPQLDDAARRIAQGAGGKEAARSAGYRPTRMFTVNMSGQQSTRAVAELMGHRYCKPLADPQLTDIGLHRQGASWWLVLAEPFSPPLESAAGSVAARVLALTNGARSQPRRCGDQSFAAAGPLAANALLDRAAGAHARDMARHGFLEHAGRDGSSPDERASRAAYRWRSIGENIAGGQTTAEQVVREWIHSPMHCANLMNPVFTEMGIAYAVNIDSPQGIYWAQALARPR